MAALSANPARLLACSDRIGSLEPGKDADLVLLDADFGNCVMRRGEWAGLSHNWGSPSMSRRDGVRGLGRPPSLWRSSLRERIDKHIHSGGGGRRPHGHATPLSDITYRVRSLRPHATHRSRAPLGQGRQRGAGALAASATR
ncbi:hypothetical protein SGLAM104S_07801 [Streptomyces glaucescens]